MTPEPPGDRPVLTVTRGRLAGAHVPLPIGRHLVGRDPSNSVRLLDPTVAPVQVVLDVDPDRSVRASKPGAHESPRPDGAATPLSSEHTLRFGAVGLSLASVGDASPALVDERPDGRRMLLRGPRPRAATGSAPLVVPRPPEPPRAVELSWVLLVAPVAMGLIAAAFFSPVLAVFALLSPTLVLGSWYESRRRSRRDHRLDRDRFDAELARFADHLDQARRREARARRAAHPDAAEVSRRARHTDARLWERREGHDDFLAVAVGHGSCRWQPVLDRPFSRQPDSAEVVAILDASLVLAEVPIAIDLRPGNVVGLIGDRSAVLALTRHLLTQVAVHHGPADVEIGVEAEGGRADDWRWLAGAPHLSVDPERPRPADPAIEGDGALVVVVDGQPVVDRQATIRSLVAGGRATLLVLASTRTSLPAECTIIVETIDGAGQARLDGPGADDLVDLHLDGMPTAVAQEITDALGQLHDPDRRGGPESLPDRVTLDQLSLDPVTGADIASAGQISTRWQAHGDRNTLLATIGVDREGPCTIDLIADGPHGLIGGTTGAGKSELLRTLVVSLAQQVPPDRLSFLLVDYKGGSAFDACTALPHTVGVVTDLDEHLAARALLSLEAELRRRERCLRDAGESDLTSYLRSGAPEPLARLVIIVDEFAALASDVPDFIDALVGVAQRGRSLGLHLVLATQRPAGIVSEAIRTNTNLRIALRMLSPADSSDVVGTADAASLLPEQPGRAFMRRGPHALVATQTALTTHLGRRVSTIAEAAERAGVAPATRPWIDPLPNQLSVADLMAHPLDPIDDWPTDDPLVVTLGWADDPTHQQRRLLRWPVERGNLLVYGRSGSGGEPALLTTASQWTHRLEPRQLHVYGLEHQRGLGALGALPHTGDVLNTNDRARVRRLFHRLTTDLERRQQAPTEPWPRVLLVIDHLEALLGGGLTRADLHLADTIARVLADGPAFGVHSAIRVGRVSGVPAPIVAASGLRLALTLPDDYDYVALGLRHRPPDRSVPGRGYDVESGLEIQLAMPDPLATVTSDDPATDTVAAGGDERGKSSSSDRARSGQAYPVAELPAQTTLASLDVASVPPTAARPPWFLPLGLGDHEVDVVGFHLDRGDGALIIGPRRSGRSTALCTLAQVVGQRSPGTVVVGVAPRASPLAASPHLTACFHGVEQLAVYLPTVTRLGTPWFVLIDDAELLDGLDDTLGSDLSDGEHQGHVVVAVRVDRLAQTYGRWVPDLASSGTGLVLWPDDRSRTPWDLPSLTPEAQSRLPGRGVLVDDGALEAIQVAMP